MLNSLKKYTRIINADLITIPIMAYVLYYAMIKTFKWYEKKNGT